MDHRRRRRLRLKDFDYSQPGGYFVTVCTANRGCLFGEIFDGAMRLNYSGAIVQNAWETLPAHYDHVELDAFVVMPNHVHGIVMLADQPTGAGFKPAPTPTDVVPAVGAGFKRAPTMRHPLSEIVRAFKTFSARRINLHRATAGAPVWQRNYYEHIVRDERALSRIRAYIVGNPMRWSVDPENPDCKPAGTSRRPVGARLKPAPTERLAWSSKSDD